MKRISDLKVPELHDELTKRGLSKKGKKQELINVSKNCVGDNDHVTLNVWAVLRFNEQDVCRRAGIRSNNFNLLAPIRSYQESGQGANGNRL